MGHPDYGCGPQDYLPGAAGAGAFGAVVPSCTALRAGSLTSLRRKLGGMVARTSARSPFW